MWRELRAWAAAGCVLALLHAPAAASGLAPNREEQQQAAKPQADMSAKCKAMMTEHDKMMSEMKSADERLDGLVSKMNAASGQEKTDAIAAVVTELVEQRKTMRERMTGMQQNMMSHMAEHMQAGPQSMAMCPMMKMGGMKH